MKVEEGDEITVTIDDFEDTRFPKDQNPRKVSGPVNNIAKDINYSAGEIQRVVTIGNPWDDGCNIDCGDTAKNKLTNETYETYTYTKAWQPRVGKDRLLLGKVVEAKHESD